MRSTENYTKIILHNPNMGEIWTNPAVGLNVLIKFLTQHPIWVKTTLHF